VGNRAARQAAKFTFGCACLIWLAGIAVLVSVLPSGVAQFVVSGIWTVVLIVGYAVLVKRAREVDERWRWEKHEATRHRKQCGVQQIRRALG
jgi:hypothetical protein